MSEGPSTSSTAAPSRGAADTACTVCAKSFRPRHAFQVRTVKGRTAHYCSLPCRASADATSGAACTTCQKRFEVVYAYQAYKVGAAIRYACSEACRAQAKAMRRPAAAPARTVAVLNQKGGTGKTTTSISCAAALAERGHRVLLIDADPQGNVAASLGVRSPKTLFDVMMRGVPVLDATVPLARDFDLLTSDEELAMAEIELAARPKRAGVLQRMLAPVRRSYDTIIIDCGPSLSLLNQNVLCSADEVLVPVACDYLSLIGVKQVKRTLKYVNERLGHKIDVGGVVPTFYDARQRICRDALEALQGHFKERCLPPIRQNVRIKEAPSKKKTIFEHDPNSLGAKDYLRMVDVWQSMRPVVVAARAVVQVAS